MDMAETTRVNLKDVRSQAADWLLRLEDAKNDGAVRSAFETWRREDSRHDTIFRQMEQIWRTAAASPSPASRPRKRTVLASVSMVVVAFLLAQLLPMGYWLADARTGSGEIKRVALDDGSYLVLNGDSAVNIHYDAARRTIHLIRGEVVAQVAHDTTGRPFRIENRDGSATALGTRYLVRQQAAETVVVVLESHVGVVARDLPNQQVALRAGEQMRLHVGYLGRIEVAPPDVGDWANMRLTFQDAPLDQVLAALDRYHPEHLRWVATDGVALRFTGTLPADDLVLALGLLEQTLPLKMQRTGDQWVVAVVQ